jgi:hypothetical protein
MSYEITYDEFDKRTDKLVELLQDDTELHEGLPAKPTVHKGPPLKSPEQVGIYVYRERVDNPDYWMGTQGSDFVATWAIVGVLRHAGDPEQLESYVSTLAANIMRNIIANRQVSGFWDVATPGPSIATRVRGDSNQTFEVEAIPVRLQWQIAHA